MFSFNSTVKNTRYETIVMGIEQKVKSSTSSKSQEFVISKDSNSLIVEKGAKLSEENLAFLRKHFCNKAIDMIKGRLGLKVYKTIF